jgi:formate dehydrogenase subunit gamma
LTDNDKQWLKQWKDVMNNDEHKLPEVGRYNGGQKMLFWVMVICMIVLLVTGLIFWRGWPNIASYFGIGTIRLATLLHAIAATVLIVGIIVHIYAAMWVKGTIGAMTRGFVSHKWAAKHHPAWYRELTRRS